LKSAFGCIFFETVKTNTFLHFNTVVFFNKTNKSEKNMSLRTQYLEEALDPKYTFIRLLKNDFSDFSDFSAFFLGIAFPYFLCFLVNTCITSL